MRVTDTKEAFEAARPNVDPRYKNYVVEGRIEWFGQHITTYVIPVNPDYQTRPTRLRSGDGGIGVVFDGVQFDPTRPFKTLLPLKPLVRLTMLAVISIPMRDTTITRALPEATRSSAHSVDNPER